MVTAHALLNGSSDVCGLQQEDGGHGAGLKEGSTEIQSKSEVNRHTDFVRSC